MNKSATTASHSNNLFLQLNSECFSWNEWAEKVRQETKQEFIHQFLKQISHLNSNNNYTEGIRHGIEVMDYIHKVQTDAKDYIRYLLQTSQFASSSEEESDEMEEYDLEKLNVDGESDEDKNSTESASHSSDVEYLVDEEEEEKKSKEFIHQFAKQRVQLLLEQQLHSHAQ